MGRKHVSRSRPSEPDSHQGCKLLLQLFFKTCVQTAVSPPIHPLSSRKFTDDTTLTGPLSGGDESARQQSDHLVSWCSQNNLELSPSKRVQLVMDLLLSHSLLLSHMTHQSALWNPSAYWTQSSHKTSGRNWTSIPTQVKPSRGCTWSSAIQNAISESILTHIAGDWRPFQRIIYSAEVIILNLPSIQGLYALRSAKVICDWPFLPWTKTFWDVSLCGKFSAFWPATNLLLLNMFMPRPRRLTEWCVADLVLAEPTSKF